MKYIMKKIDKAKFSVYEIDTENFIKTFDNAKDCIQMCKDLNLNKYGFEGWTPSFILQSFTIDFSESLDIHTK